MCWSGCSPPAAEVLTGVQDEAVLSHLAGGIAVKKIVGAGAVQGEAIAGVAVSVGKNRLVAEAGIGTGTAQEIRSERRDSESPVA